jgi:glutamate:Na+ symporter, ESS family
MMELRQLRYFLAVAENGSLSKASAVLGIAQPALSRAVRTLAERYGPAPRAFLVAPMVGAFFVDFTNALIITACLNIFG